MRAAMLMAFRTALVPVALVHLGEEPGISALMFLGGLDAVGAQCLGEDDGLGLPAGCGQPVGIPAGELVEGGASQSDADPSCLDQGAVDVGRDYGATPCSAYELSVSLTSKPRLRMSEINLNKVRTPPRRGPDLRLCLVGVAGFEPTASSSRTKRAAKLRHTPESAESY